MILDSYQKNFLKIKKRNAHLIKKRNAQLIIKNNFHQKLFDIRSKQVPILPKKLTINKYFNSYSQQTNKSNYINYTFLESNESDNYKSKTERESLNNRSNNGNIKIKIVNDYLKRLKKQNSLNSSLYYDSNNKYNTERTHYFYHQNHYENNSNNDHIFMKKFNQLMKDINQDKEDLPEIKKDDNFRVLKFGSLNSINNIKKNSSIPIGRRINMLKEAKYSINKMKKDIVNTNSFSSFNSIFDNTNKINSLQLSSFRNPKIKVIKSYKDLSNQKPIMIKHLKKPKLNVPKFINMFHSVNKK